MRVGDKITVILFLVYDGYFRMALKMLPLVHWFGAAKRSAALHFIRCAFSNE
jgi:hypothetical protein